MAGFGAILRRSLPAKTAALLGRGADVGAANAISGASYGSVCRRLAPLAFGSRGCPAPAPAGKGSIRQACQTVLAPGIALASSIAVAFLTRLCPALTADFTTTPPIRLGLLGVRIALAAVYTKVT